MKPLFCNTSIALHPNDIALYRTERRPGTYAFIPAAFVLSGYRNESVSCADAVLAAQGDIYLGPFIVSSLAGD
jgi:hypothetical protein